MDKSRCDAWKDDVEKMLIFVSIYMPTAASFDNT